MISPSGLVFTVGAEGLALRVILLLALGRCYDAPSTANVSVEPQRSHVPLSFAVSSLQAM